MRLLVFCVVLFLVSCASPAKEQPVRPISVDDFVECMTSCCTEKHDEGIFEHVDQLCVNECTDKLNRKRFGLK